ncbi:hypothetical protein ANN_14409 [Periplaneta americana]|uniref:Uncharacterized protein n=1 Tax=Periplaneta americana TaxID=6978 RepID=A0ABQ8SW78_PERAM|nr:hypothetical protein ANN_14409 [Periplaneta americana]
MADLREGGNEPLGSLEAIRKMLRRILGLSRRDRVPNKVLQKISTIEDPALQATNTKWKWGGHVARLRDGRWTQKVTLSVFRISPVSNPMASRTEISQNLASVAQTITYTAAMIAIEPSSSFVPISLQRDVIVVHRSGEIRNTLYGTPHWQEITRKTKNKMGRPFQRTSRKPLVKQRKK